MRGVSSFLRCILLATACLAPVATASAQDGATADSAPQGGFEDNKGTLTLVGENDSLSSGADRNYTSGLKLAYVSHIGVLPAWAQNFGDVTERITGTRPSFWGVAVGQSLYTPEDITTTPAPKDQHPYAGWLYTQLLVAAEEVADKPRYVDLYELEMGVVGPSALGRQSQRGIHQILNAPEPKGWDSQLEDEFAFALSIERRWRAEHVFKGRLTGIEVDAAPGVGVTVGTLRTEAKAGASFRIGQNLDLRDFGPPRVRPGLGGVGYLSARREFSWYFFIGGELRGVARNIFLDGNTFRDSARVDKKPVVADLQAGAAIQRGDWRIAYTYVTRTEDFKSQGRQQDFGALALSVRY